MTQPFVFDPYALDVQVDPYPYYAVLRRDHPAYWSESAKCWALSRYDDVDAACSDPQRFSSARGNVLDDDPARMGKTLGTSDPPKHDRLRKLVNAAFMRGQVLEREPRIREITREFMDEFFAAGGGDLIQQLTARISTSTICDLLGFERADHVQLKKWVDGLVYRDPATRQLPPSGHEARKAMVAYALKTIDERRAAPREDLISALIAAEVEGDKLTAEDLMHTVGTLLAAGIESASSFIGNAMLALHEHPEQIELLAGDLRRAPNAIEEMLRYDTPTQRFHRSATQDIELHGQTIRTGQSVLVMYGSANRDERKFDDPERFDIMRAPSRHLGMGHGTHFCLGAQLAKAISRIFLEEWFGRNRGFKVLADQVVRMHSPVFRGLSRMPVQVTAH
ncbi:MAG: cytochrome [Ramlibacter sp.]|nr:cytochrome [Ramlibacter sp.]